MRLFFRNAVLILCLLSGPILTRAVENDTLKIEKIALEYFLAKLDSVVREDAMNGNGFNRKKDRIYFSGATELFEDLKLGEFKTYAFKRKHFIEAGSFDQRNYRLQCDKVPVKIAIADKLLTKGSKEDYERNRRGNDLRIAVSNRYFHNGQYFVRIFLDTGMNMFQVYFYVRVDESGTPQDWVVSSDII